MYILTQEEYDALKKEQKHSLDISKKKLQKLCTNIANAMPVVWGWNGLDPKPWGCILQEDKDHEEDWCCDKCPVTEICPNDNKEWSK